MVSPEYRCVSAWRGRVGGRVWLLSDIRVLGECVLGGRSAWGCMCL